MTAEKIFYGGPIITVNEAMPSVEAIAVAGDKIIALGSQSEVMALKDDHTTLIDLKGKTLMPGFIEPHTHPVASAFLYNVIDVSGFSNRSAKEVMARLTEAAEKTPEGEWIIAFGYDPILLRDLDSLDRKKLDAISAKHPIFVLLQAMHTGYVNSKALEVAGIDESTPAPQGGGKYYKDEQGQLTGVIIELAAMLPLLNAINQQMKDSAAELVKKQFYRYAEKGITTIGVTGLIPLLPNAFDLLKNTALASDSPIRVFHYMAGNIKRDAGEKPFTGDDQFRNIGIKYWMDGSPYTGTAHLNEPYMNCELMQKGLGVPENTCGHAMYPKKDLQALVQSCHDAGWQVAIHCQGDKAIHDVVDIYDESLKNTPREDHRHRMEHLALALEDDLDRAAKIGSTPSFHINHVYYYGEALRDEIFGPERCEHLMPVATAIKKGHRATLHTDSPMYPPNPLLCVRTATTRETRSGEVIGPEEAISIDDAIKAITINAAWQLFMEDKIGSLEVGKYADLVVLADNPYTVSPGDVDKIDIIETWSSGSRVGE